MTQGIPTATVGSSRPHYQFRWEQDSRQRVFRLYGAIDATAASHLESAIINLGARRLVVDLTEVTSLHPAAAAALLGIAERLGPGRVTVVVESDDASRMVVTDIRDLRRLEAPA